MTKGYTVEIINPAEKKSVFLHFKEESAARDAMSGNQRCILTEWAQFPDGLGDYEIELERNF